MIFWFHDAFSNMSNYPFFYALWQVNESLKMSYNPLKIVAPIWTYVKEIQQNYLESNLRVLQQHRQFTYYRNNEARSHDHCCHGGIKYHEHLSVALVIRHESACTVLYCHLWPVWLYPIVPHYLINGTIFEQKKSLYWTWNMCIAYLSSFFLKLIPFCDEYEILS